MSDKQRQYLNKYGYVWLAFLVALLPRLLFLANTYTLSISGDELFAMWPAAKAVGYDWTGVMADYRYYGYGYSALLIPLMAIFKDSIILYRCMVLLMIVMQSLVAPISCHLMSTYFEVKNKTILCLSGIACSYLVAVRAVYTYPEFVYTFVVWLIVWTLLKINRSNSKQKLLYSIILLLLMVYELTVHSRGVALWPALLGTIVIYWWVYRKTIVSKTSLLICIVIGTAGYIMSKNGINLVLKYLDVGQISNISNTTVSVSSGLFSTLRNPESWTVWLNIIMGQLNEALINTGGIAAAIVLVLLFVLWNALCRKRRILDDAANLYSSYILVSVFCFLAVIITIGGQSLTWLEGALEAAKGGNPDSFRAYTYFRYYGAYVGPLLMCGISFFVNNQEMLDWVKGKTLLVVCLLQGYWVLCILPQIRYFNGCVWSYAPYSFVKGFRDGLGLSSYLPGTIVIFIVVVLSYFLIIKKKSSFILCILCAILIYSYVYNALYHEGDRGKSNYQAVLAGCEILEKLTDMGVDADCVYIEKANAEIGGQSIIYTYQFNLLDLAVKSDAPINDATEAIFICENPEKYDDLLNEGYKLAKISDQQYLYVLGNEWQNIAESMGMIWVE